MLSYMLLLIRVGGEIDSGIDPLLVTDEGSARRRHCRQDHPSKFSAAFFPVNIRLDG